MQLNQVVQIVGAGGWYTTQNWVWIWREIEQDKRRRTRQYISHGFCVLETFGCKQFSELNKFLMKKLIHE